MQPIHLTIPGPPVAKKRPRFARKGKKVRTYNDQETAEGLFMLHALRQVGQMEPLNGPLAAEMRFFLPRPKSHYGTGKNAGLLRPSAPTHHTSTPDTDNLVKFCLDCLNGLVFKDDTQVVRILAEKVYSDRPRTVMTINHCEGV